MEKTKKVCGSKLLFRATDYGELYYLVAWDVWLTEYMIVGPLMCTSYAQELAKELHSKIDLRQVRVLNQSEFSEWFKDSVRDLSRHQIYVCSDEGERTGEVM